MPNFTIDKTLGQGSAKILVTPTAVNKGNSDLVANVQIFSSTYGTTQTVILRQKKANLEYVFSISPLDIVFNRLGGSTPINIEKSYKLFNGTNQTDVGYTVTTNLPSGITYNDSTKSVTCEENLGVSVEGTITFTQNESGKQLVVRVSQREASIETEFSVSPTNIDFEATGGTKGISVTSRQSVNEGPWEEVSWTYSTDLPSGISFNGSTITANASSSSSSKSGSITFTQEGTGKKITIYVSQKAAELEYEFSVTPTEYNFPMDGGEKTFTVVSRRKVNGVWEDVDYSSAFTSSVPAGWSWDEDTNTITVPKNSSTTSQPSFYIRFVQDGTNDTIDVHITQSVYSEESYQIYAYDLGELLGTGTLSKTSISIDWDDTNYKIGTSSNNPVIWVVVVRVKTVNGTPTVDISTAAKLRDYIASKGGLTGLTGDVTPAVKGIDYQASTGNSWIELTISEDINAAMAGVPAVFPTFEQNTSTSSREGDIDFEVPENQTGTYRWSCHVTQGGKPEEPEVPKGVFFEDGSDTKEVSTYSGSTSWTTGWMNVTSFDASGNPVTPTVKLPSYWESFLDADVEDRGEGNYRIRISVIPSEVDTFRSNSGNGYIYIGNSYDSESIRINFVINTVDLQVSNNLGGTVAGWDSSKYFVIQVQSDPADPVYGAGTNLYSLHMAVKQNTGTFLALQPISTITGIGSNYRKLLGHRVKIMHAWKDCVVDRGSVPSSYGDEISDQIVDIEGRRVSSNPTFGVPDNQGESPVVTINASLRYQPT